MDDSAKCRRGRAVEFLTKNTVSVPTLPWYRPALFLLFGPAVDDTYCSLESVESIKMSNFPFSSCLHLQGLLRVRLQKPCAGPMRRQASPMLPVVNRAPSLRSGTNVVSPDNNDPWTSRHEIYFPSGPAQVARLVAILGEAVFCWPLLSWPVTTTHHKV
ncbi:unnamed protein product [Protopolystoma xenopodis]|uniref:Uncharacterized protein n=1 Tax=Protopolystoma xenopodis TaxID=117903 RepID=A0A448XJU3_9PLAT|nr:unnamed protein product [Protopolystoma xenopodis]